MGLELPLFAIADPPASYRHVTDKNPASDCVPAQSESCHLMPRLSHAQRETDVAEGSRAHALRFTTKSQFLMESHAYGTKGCHWKALPTEHPRNDQVKLPELKLKLMLCVPRLFVPRLYKPGRQNAAKPSAHCFNRKVRMTPCC